MFELKRHPDGQEPHHVIIGGGFSGLYLAWRLRQAGVWVRLYEAGQFGGMIQTRQTVFGPTETAANGFLANPSLVELAKDLEIPILKANDESKARFIHSSRGFQRWPLSILQSVLMALRILWSLVSGRMPPRADESVRDWGERVLGHAATERLLRPATRGIYVLPAEELSAQLVLGRFFAKRKRRAKLKGRIKGTVSFPRGMGQLIGALVERLNEDPGTQLIQKCVTPADLEEFHKNPAVRKIWIALSSPAAAALTANLEPKLAQALAAVPRVPVVTATAFFTRDARDRDGFGYLNHPELGGEVLGVLFNDRIFKGRSEAHRSETYIMKGENLAQAPDAKIRELIEETRARDTGRALPALHVEIQRWPAGLPRYDFALAQVQPEFQKDWGKIRLVGNYVAGIGLTRITEWVDDQFEGKNR